MKHLLLSIFIISVLFSCTQSATLTETEKATIIADIQLTLNDYHNAIKKSGLTAELKYLDSSADFFWVPPGYTAPISYDSVVSILKQNAPQFSHIDNSFKSLRIIPLTKELASYTGQVDSKMTDTSAKMITVSLIETGVLIKRTDGWKLLHGQTAVLN